VEELWLTVSFDRVAEIYDETRGFPVFVMDKIIETLVDELEGYVSILDVGVGTARFSMPLQAQGHCVVGVDVSFGMLRKAVERGMGNLLIGSVCSLPFRDDSFDVTISVGVLHLVKEWKVALREVSRVTRKLLVSVIHRGRIPPRKEYVDVLVEYGWKLPRLGIAERELGTLIKPVKSIDVASYEASVSRSLDFMERKAYSYQWDVPEEMHMRIMQQLRTRSFPDAYSVKVEISVWDINSIRDLAKSRKDG
jgi:ubiquinone/menaquinone biosynthesis C-methylase UbiE